MPTLQTDDDLMDLVKQGNTAAFKTLLERHGNAVFGYCMRTLSGNRALAEDITQEVWLKVVRKCDLYSSRGQFKAWLMTITRNSAISEIRKTSKLTHFEINEEGEIPADFNLEDQLVKNHEADSVKAAIDALPDPQRIALTMWLMEDLPYEDIAKEMDTSVSAVKSLLFRAKQGLKKAIGA